MLPKNLRLLYEILGNFGSQFAATISMQRTDLFADNLKHEITGQDNVLAKLSTLTKNLKTTLETLMKLPDAEHRGIFINRVPAEIPDFYQKLPSNRCNFCCFLIEFFRNP